MWQELEQEPYDPEEFVERLAWRATNAGAGGPGGGGATSGEVDVTQLHDAFIQAIKDLTVMHDKQKKKCQVLEQVIIAGKICMSRSFGSKKLNFSIFRNAEKRSKATGNVLEV